MKKIVLSLISLGFAWSGFSQGKNIIYSPEISNITSIQSSDLVKNGIQKQIRTDELGMIHQKIQQKQGDFAVEGAIIILHKSQDGSIKKSGHFVEGINQQKASAKIHFKEALSIAKNEINTDFFYWESPEHEKLIKNLENNTAASFFPKEELVWLDPNFGNDGKQYRLAYKFELFFNAEIDHKTIYVDANSGEVLLSLDQCNHASVEGTAKTRYHGERKIITDSVAPNKFTLLDKTRGGGIETLNIRTYNKLDSAVSFEDDDNHWDHDNAEMDNAATDVHFGSEQTYDYFLKVHGRNSFDGEGSKILSYVHYNKNWRNASWNGKYARYGDGTNNPLTSIDVVSHELTHGVTGTSAALIYRNESGALNESFSDIFGTAVEFYALGDEADWFIGKANFLLREMGNTKRFSHPNTYGGVYWYTGTGDNGGVHINSGVQNYWFYLLCNGGTGTNDLGNDFSVDSIGMEKAAAIAFRNLTYYLTPSSNFEQARSGAIEAAKDLYGVCSWEVEQVLKAWHAVGVGAPSTHYDLKFIDLGGISSDCNVGEEEIVLQFTLAETACDSIIEAGSEIDLFFKVNQNTPVKETLVLDQNLKLFDTLSYQFKGLANFNQVDVYKIKAWVYSPLDDLHSNDSSETITVVHKTNPTKDDVIGFEPKDIDHEKVLYSIEERENSTVEVVIKARKTGVRGLMFTGEPSGRIRDFVAPASENKIFSTYPNHIGKMCMCVDARNWKDVFLSFDLRQTYSAIYYDHLKNYDPKNMTSFRVTVNGEQIDTIFHPDTTASDTFRNHLFNLSDFAGTAFELCFEGQHFISQTSFSSENVGDNSYLDNINIRHNELHPDPEGFNIKWYPNPSTGSISFDSYQESDKNLEISVRDALGRLIFEQDIPLKYGSNHIEEQWDFLSNGFYFVYMTVNGETNIEKLIIQ